MINVNNLLDRLAGNEREVATYIILGMKHSRFSEKTFTVDEMCKKLLVNRTTVYKVMDKLLISEVIRREKQKTGVYVFKPYCKGSFKLVSKVLEDEQNG